MKIFETVMGSNHRFIQDQTVGKKAGAPIIWRCVLGMGDAAYDAVSGVKNLQIYDPMFLDNELWQEYWHLAYGPLNSRIDVDRRRIYRRYCWTVILVSLDVVDL
jgi:hypothetical protein